jgi:hypothetical protein
MSFRLRRFNCTLELSDLILVDFLGLPRCSDFRLDLQTSSFVIDD